MKHTTWNIKHTRTHQPEWRNVSILLILLQISFYCFFKWKIYDITKDGKVLYVLHCNCIILSHFPRDKYCVCLPVHDFYYFVTKSVGIACIVVLNIYINAISVCVISEIFLLSIGFYIYPWHPIPVFLPGKSHRQRSLVGCGPWRCEESDTTEQFPFHFSLSCIGEGNDNPPQCFCLENPRDGEPGGLPSMGSSQSRTRLMRLSSSSMFTYINIVLLL